MNPLQIDVSAPNQILDALSANEPGDARSLLDEHFPTGNFSLTDLDASNPEYEWAWDSHDGWSYTEI